MTAAEVRMHPIRLIHLSDIHFWQYALNPAQLFSKRLLGMGELLVRRARKFRLERIQQVVDRVNSLRPDHLLITGDLTTTALPAEFRAARQALDPLLGNADSVTILPGNHDRYTLGAQRDRRFENFFGEFAPQLDYPWLRNITPDTAILGLDPTRASLTARGVVPAGQFESARHLLASSSDAVRRLIVACHYPLEAPLPYRADLRRKRLMNAEPLASWLAMVGPHLYCCGHVHAAWAFRLSKVPNQLCLNAGAPLLRHRANEPRPGFLEIMLQDHGVTVHHQAWAEDRWDRTLLHDDPGFFSSGSETMIAPQA